MDFITVEAFGITWVRPNNLLTNQLVGIFGIILFYQIKKFNRQKDPYLRLWAWFFLLIGLGGALGGFAHGLNIDFPAVKHTTLHKVAWTIAGTGLFLGEIASLYLYKKPKIQRILLWVAYVQFSLYIVVLFYSQIYHRDDFNHFNIPRFNSAFAMLGVILPAHIYAYVKDRNPALFYLLGGIAFLIGTVIFYNFSISFHPWFDYNDISHVLEIICLALIARGVIKGYPMARGEVIPQGS